MSVKDTYMMLIQKLIGNSYIQADADYEIAMLIAKMYRDHPKHYVKILTSKKNREKFRHVVDWAFIKTSFLYQFHDFIFNFSTRLCWIFNDKNLNDVECAYSGCSNTINFKIQLKISDPFPEYCSSSCANSDPKTLKKSRATRKMRYGSETYTNTEKAQRTFRKHVKENLGFLDDINERSRQTRIRNGHSPTWNNREKAVKTFSDHCRQDSNFLKEKQRKDKKTRLDRYGNENFTNPDKSRKTRSLKNGDGVWMSDSQKEKMKATFAKNHDGKTSSFQLDGVKDKCIKTWIENLGVDCPLKSPHVQKKIKETNIRNLGVDHPWKSEEIIDKANSTKMRKYGSVIQSHQTYRYDDQDFDSSWEVALWIFCKENNIQIERATVSFKFMSNGKEHTYFPDFVVDGKLVEVKGDQFFNESGEMTCPYRDRHWSDEKYAEVCQLYRDKHKCMVDNNVTILRHKDIDVCFDFINNHHGKGFINKFKVSK